MLQSLSSKTNRGYMNYNRLYVFFGYWSEYTLNPLFTYMKAQGYNCVEVTPTNCSDMRKLLFELNANDCFFITSAHVFIDNTFNVYNNTHLSALEAIDILNPKKTVFYPHDLADLLEEFGMPWLNSIFDIILFPIDGYAHLSCHGKPIYNVGWIKKNKKTGIGTQFKVGHGIGEWIYYRNLDYNILYNTFKEIWQQGVIIKNSGGGKKLQVFLENNNVRYINTKTSIFELIDSCEIMLTNGITSVNIESALSGRFTINMLDGIADQATHEKLFKGLPNFKIMSISDTAELLKAYYKGDFIPTQGNDLLKLFDFELATKLITA